MGILKVTDPETIRLIDDNYRFLALTFLKLICDDYVEDCKRVKKRPELVHSRNARTRMAQTEIFFHSQLFGTISDTCLPDAAEFDPNAFIRQLKQKAA